DPKQPIARYVLAEIALHAQNSDRARELFDGLIADGHDGYDIRARLAQLALDDHDLARPRSSCAPRRSSIPSAAIHTRRSRSSTRKQATSRARSRSSSITSTSSRWST